MIYLKAILGTLAVCGFLAVCGEATLLLRQLDLSLVQITAHADRTLTTADSTLTDASRTLQIVAGTAGNIEKGTRAWKASSEAILSTEQQTAALITDLRGDVALQNGNLSALMSQSTALAQQWGKLALPTQDAVENASLTFRTLNTGLSQTLPDIQTSAKNTADATMHADATLTDMQTFIHRITSPPKGVWHAVEHFIGWAGPTTVVAIK